MEHPADTATINANIAALDLQIASTPGAREPFSLDLVREWHRRVHEGTRHVPRAEYVGGFRGEGSVHLRTYDIRFGNFVGAPAATVAGHLLTFEANMTAALARWDALIPTTTEATTSRLNVVLEQAAALYATWIRVHPFADGNGRTARVLMNWLMVRYGQPLILPGRPVADKDGLVAATAPAMPAGAPNLRPLVNHLRKRLATARSQAVQDGRAAQGDNH